MSSNSPGRVPAHLQRNFSRASLLRQYARIRLRHVWLRLAAGIAVAATLWVIDGAAVALTCALLLLVGEAVDCAFLSRVPVLLTGRMRMRRVYLLCTVTAGVQAATISAAIALAWFHPASGSSPLLCMSLLMASAVNASALLPLQQAAGKVRLALHALILPVMVLPWQNWGVPMQLPRQLDLIGAGILAIIVLQGMRYLQSKFARRKVHIRALYRQSLAIAVANDRLRSREREARRQALVARYANDAVILSGRDGRILWINDAFTRITGYTPQEVIGNTPSTLLNCPETDRKTVQQIDDAREAGRIFRGEVQNRTKDGRRIWMEINLVPVRENGGPVEMFIAIERDVTDAHCHAEEMARARKAAEEAMHAKASFLAMMSHEIRTPMNGIIGMAELLSRSPMGKEQQQLVGTMRDSADSLLRIINDLLDMSKLEERQITLCPVDFDPRAMLSGIIRLLSANAEAKGISLKLEVAAQVPQYLNGDDGRLRQIMLNLIGNAMKFTAVGGVTIRIKALVGDDGAYTLCLAVEDTGIGIAPERLETIFERFRQADDRTAREHGGSGLGLTISRLLAQAMGGDITVTSAPGMGSCFEARVVMQPGAPPIAQVEECSAGLRSLAGLRVLVAEDNQTNRLVIGKYLDNLQLDISFAHDGAEAVERTAEIAPDIVLMDMSMPRLSGIEATRRIRARPGPQPRIIALTANAFDTDRQDCLTAGMDGFLAKPARRAELLHILRAHAGQMHGDDHAMTPICIGDPAGTAVKGCERE